jgi:hypothetical protein
MANQDRLMQRLNHLRDRHEEKHRKTSSNDDVFGPVQEDFEDMSLKKKIKECEDSLRGENVRPGTGGATYAQEDERMKAAGVKPTSNDDLDLAAAKPASNDDLLGDKESGKKKNAGIATGLTVEGRHAQSPNARKKVSMSILEEDRQQEARLKSPAQKEVDDKAFRERMRAKLAGKRDSSWN